MSTEPTTILYTLPPVGDEPGLIITDQTCPHCGWPETITRLYPDGSGDRGCAGCESVHAAWTVGEGKQ